MSIDKNSVQIEILGLYGSIFLYTRNDGVSCIADIHEALSLKTKWEDPDMLSRIIFCRMISQAEWRNIDDYGICPQLYDDTNYIIIIDTVSQHIHITCRLDKSIKHNMSFNDFINNYIQHSK